MAAKQRLLSTVPVDRAACAIAAMTQSAPTGVAMRKFAAAEVNRLTSTWLTGSQRLDEDLKRDLDAVRSRSRDLSKNNEYAAKFFKMVRNNVVGSQGFVLQSAVKDPNGKEDGAASRAIEDAWYRFNRPGNFEVTGKLSGDDFFRLAVTTLAKDGEILIRKVMGKGRGEYGFQLQLLDIERLDTSYNRNATAATNAVVMGVEMDAYRAPVAYHILKSDQTRPGTRERERILAAEIIHQFIPLEAEQTRGVPWLHAAMVLLRQLGGYREAAVIAARIGAAKMGMYVSKEGDPPPTLPGATVDDRGNFITTAEPGTFEVAPHGYTLETYDPTYPHEQFGAFVKAALQGVASAATVAYHALANDLEGVNFSSIRSGVLEEREEWMVVQAWMMSALLTPIFEQWLGHALMGGLVRLANGTALPASKADKFRPHTWQGRRWAWVDPMKDVQASVLAIDNLLASPQQIAAQTGRDIIDVLDDIQRFKELCDERGIVKPTAVSKKPAVASAQGAPDDDPDDDA